MTSSHRPVVERLQKQLLTQNRAQDAPHSLGGELAEQFSWSALVDSLYDTSIKFKGALQEL
jgi:hypothetical protein